MGYRQAGWLGGKRDLSSLHSIQTGSGTQLLGTGGSFSRIKRAGHDFDHSPSIAEAMNGGSVHPFILPIPIHLHGIVLNCLINYAWGTNLAFVFTVKIHHTLQMPENKMFKKISEKCVNIRGNY